MPLQNPARQRPVDFSDFTHKYTAPSHPLPLLYLLCECACVIVTNSHCFASKSRSATRLYYNILTACSFTLPHTHCTAICVRTHLHNAFKIPLEPVLVHLTLLYVFIFFFSLFQKTASCSVHDLICENHKFQSG